MKRNNATLIELLVFLVCIGIGIKLSAYYFPAGGIGGFFLGLIGAFLIVGFLVFLIGDLIFGGIPRFPYCEEKKCKGLKNYTSEMMNEDIYISRCKCGHLYIREGRRFLKIDGNANKTKYLVWIPLLGWKIDK